MPGVGGAALWSQAMVPRGVARPNAWTQALTTGMRCPLTRGKISRVGMSRIVGERRRMG
jgi:hypothetical protein